MADRKWTMANCLWFVFQYPLHHRDKGFYGHVAFYEVLVDAERNASIAARFVAEVCKRYHGKLPRSPGIPLEHLEPVHHGHIEIKDQKIRRFLGNQSKGLFAVNRQADLVPRHGKFLLIHLPKHGIILGNEDIGGLHVNHYTPAFLIPNSYFPHICFALSNVSTIASRDLIVISLFTK